MEGHFFYETFVNCCCFISIFHLCSSSTHAQNENVPHTGACWNSERWNSTFKLQLLASKCGTFFALLAFQKYFKILYPAKFSKLNGDFFCQKCFQWSCLQTQKSKIRYKWVHNLLMKYLVVINKRDAINSRKYFRTWCEPSWKCVRLDCDAARLYGFPWIKQNNVNKSALAQ